jgi:hypothetical protein
MIDRSGACRPESESGPTHALVEIQRRNQLAAQITLSSPPPHGWRFEGPIRHAIVPECVGIAA